MCGKRYFAVCVDKENTGLPVYAPFTSKQAAAQHAADMNNKVMAEHYGGSDKAWFNDKNSICWVGVDADELAQIFPAVAQDFARGTLQ